MPLEKLRLTNHFIQRHIEHGLYNNICFSPCPFGQVVAINYLFERNFNLSKKLFRNKSVYQNLCTFT